MRRQIVIGNDWGGGRRESLEEIVNTPRCHVLKAVFYLILELEFIFGIFHPKIIHSIEV